MHTHGKTSSELCQNTCQHNMKSMLRLSFFSGVIALYEKRKQVAFAIWSKVVSVFPNSQVYEPERAKIELRIKIKGR